jgi:hypothetical protein
MNKSKLIELLSSTLKKDSKFYSDDRATIASGVNRMTPKQRNEAAARHIAIMQTTQKEINFHCKI